MFQELISFAIVALAIVVALLKIHKRFRKKKPGAADFHKVKMAEAHNCQDCAADCVLRDLPKHIIDKSTEMCDTNYTANKADKN